MLLRYEGSSKARLGRGARQDGAQRPKVDREVMCGFCVDVLKTAGDRKRDLFVLMFVVCSTHQPSHCAPA